LFAALEVVELRVELDGRSSTRGRKIALDAGLAQSLASRASSLRKPRTEENRLAGMTLCEGLPDREARAVFRHYVEENIPLGAAVDGCVLEVIRNHPDYESKCPPGSVVKRERNPRCGDWMLVVYQNGQFRDDISWNVALRRRGKTWTTRVAQAARLAVNHQIVEFKARCDATPGMHADHCGEGFTELFKRFLAGREVELVEDEFKMDRLALESEWQEFHLKHAELQLLTPEEHRRVTKERRVFDVSAAP
jgi:hypothetical protein